MDKLFGESFDEYVHNQVNIRQSSLKKHQKDVDDLQVFNASTPWIRLTSSITIDAQRTKELATNLDIDSKKIEGSNLAKNLVLFAGVSKGDNLKNRIGGVGYGLDNTYGFLSDKEQGYKPMPGITNISTTYKNNGSLKQAQVNITCFTRKQFEALEALYLRLGYTVILEWGHSVYFDNNGEKQNMSATNIPNLMFKKPKKVDPQKEAKKAVAEALRKNPNLEWYEQDEIYFDKELEIRKENESKDLSPSRIRKQLYKTRKETGGNYDGMLAKVVNFSWNLNNDLSYSITLNLSSVGDIIDSLKMNVGGVNLTNDRIRNVKVERGVQNITNIALNASTSTFHSFLYELTTTLTEDKLAKGETNAATQEISALADRARDAEELLDFIKKPFTKVIRAKKAVFDSFTKARELILQNPKFDLKVEGSNFSVLKADPKTARSYGYAKKTTIVPEFNALIRENNKNVPKDRQIEERFLMPDRISIVVLKELGLNVKDITVDISGTVQLVGGPGVEGILNSDAFIRGEVISNNFSTNSDTIYARNRELIQDLDKIAVYFENLSADGEKDAETNNTNLIFYLEQQVRENKSNIPSIIENILQEGYFDKDEKYDATFIFK